MTACNDIKVIKEAFYKAFSRIFFPQKGNINDNTAYKSTNSLFAFY